MTYLLKGDIRGKIQVRDYSSPGFWQIRLEEEQWIKKLNLTDKRMKKTFKLRKTQKQLDWSAQGCRKPWVRGLAVSRG